jgi:tRNA threonylcarbamoyladenosine biosynthesis protein TsaE
LQRLEFILEENRLTEAAEKLLVFAGEKRIFLFFAGMGAGKTTFIKALCSTLGVNGNMSSPTYSIVNEYLTVKGEKIFHFDLYRLKSAEECLDIGFEEYLSSGSYCFVEWPEVAEMLIMTNIIRVHITLKDNVRYLCATNS